VAGLAAAALLLVVLGAFGWWRQSARAGELSAQIERERADSLRLARTIALMKSMESRRDTIEQKMAVIRSVDGRRYQWPHLLDEISRAVPPYTWLTRVAAGGLHRFSAHAADFHRLRARRSDSPARSRSIHRSGSRIGSCAVTARVRRSPWIRGTGIGPVSSQRRARQRQHHLYVRLRG